ncbi:MAG: potassium channel protein [Deltaproteobacteria bacterium]
MDVSRTLVRALIGLAIVLTIGTVGYQVLEGWSLLDSLYMTVITITTIGFKEVHALSPRGTLFTIVIIMLGMGVVGYTILNGTRFVVEGEVTKILTRRRAMKAIGRIKDHFIICGFGRMGSFVCNQLQERGIPFVVVENRGEVQDSIVQSGYLLVPGDATKEESLLTAGVESARGLVSLLDSDAENVYVVLSAHRLNPDLDIIARAGEESAAEKLQWAGATRVISPYQIGGMRLVMGILKPKVMSFIELAMDYKELNLDIEEVEVWEGSPYCGKKLIETNIRRELNLIIVAVIKKNGNMVFNPGSTTLIENGDTLIAMGERNSLHALEKMAEQS